MTAPTITAARELDEPLTWTISEVAAITKISKRRILDACRAGKLDHVYAGTRVMTQEQIDAMLRAFSTGVRHTEKPKPADPLEAARQASLRSGARRSPRRPR